MKVVDKASCAVGGIVVDYVSVEETRENDAGSRDGYYPPVYAVHVDEGNEYAADFGKKPLEAKRRHSTHSPDYDGKHQDEYEWRHDTPAPLCETVQRLRSGSAVAIVDSVVFSGGIHCGGGFCQCNIPIIDITNSKEYCQPKPHKKRLFHKSLNFANQIYFYKPNIN